MQPILEVKKISKIYDELSDNPICALNEVDFTMEEGEFVCVMGPSGAGKSTFLNCISMIDTPTIGNIKMDGKRVDQLGPNEIGKVRYETLGIVLQHANLLNNLSLLSNIAIPLTLYNEKKDVIVERVNNLAEKMGIKDLLKKYPSDCSGGQKQRAAICRALINNPKLIIADEPTGDLDSKNSQDLMKLFVDLNKDNISILMVTHDPIVASYSDRVVYIKDGVINTNLYKENLTQQTYYNEILKLSSRESFDTFE